MDAFFDFISSRLKNKYFFEKTLDKEDAKNDISTNNLYHDLLLSHTKKTILANKSPRAHQETCIF